MATVINEVPTLPQVRFNPTEGTATQAGVYQCLVASKSMAQTEMLQGAAGRSGWKVVVCQSLAKAMQEIKRLRFHLAIVDLFGGGKDASEFKALAEQLAMDKDVLLIFCGNEEDPLEEIWARQLGAWLYLPGVDETCDIASLCVDARTVTQRSQELISRLT